MALTQRTFVDWRKSAEMLQKRLDPAAAQARIEAAFARRRPGTWWCWPAVAAVWMLAAAYFFLLPPSYQSKWSLILPTANNGSTVSLESIGQTSSSPSQPFGSVSLSPKVIYKEIAASERVRTAAAKSMGMHVRSFGRARVKLIDETSLMMFRISGRTPERAQAKARALMAAFNDQLSALRRDEREKRASFVRDNLKIYRANLEKARQKIIDYQRISGLLSIDQYKEISSSEELLRRKLGSHHANHQRLVAQQAALTARLNLSPELAAYGVRLASDASFVRLSKVYAESSATVHESDFRFGPNHPALVNARMKAKGALVQLTKIARQARLGSANDLRRLVLVMNNSHQSELLKAIVANESALAGSEKELESLKNELTFLEFKVAQLGKSAAKLEALQKEHLVAEAVFTSATARLDLSRTDLFSSYPMVQVLETPGLPANRSQPRLRYAIAAGVLGSFFILLAWGAIWVRSRFVPRR
jgi:uncharacterized protein involved in exopolysaccharide biosynthesis